MSPSAIITGFGPGLSAHVATALVERGYRVAGLSRSGAFGTEFATQHQRFTSYACDVTDRAAMASTVREFAAGGGAATLLVHNAAEFVTGEFLELDTVKFERSWRVACLGAVHAAQLVLPDMLKAGAGTLLFTGATASLRGGASFSAFASAKFAVRALAQSLARAYGPRGIHVAHVVIDGVIWGEQASELGVSRDNCLEPSAIADAYLMLVEQKRSAWTHELDLRPANERF